MYDTQTITEAIGKLTATETQTLFNLVRNHAGLIDKLVPGLPLIVHALGQQALDHPIAEQYAHWLTTQDKGAIKSQLNAKSTAKRQAINQSLLNAET